MKDLQGLKFNLWEKYGKKRIYVKGLWDKAFLYENKNGKLDISNNFNTSYESDMLEDLDKALMKIGIQAISMEFDEAVEILRKNELL